MHLHCKALNFNKIVSFLVVYSLEIGITVIIIPFFYDAESIAIVTIGSPAARVHYL